MATEFDELNVLESRQDEMVENLGSIIDEPNRTMMTKEVEDDLEDLLVMAYVLGSDYANRVLGTEVKPTEEEVREAVYHRIENEDFKDRIRKHLASGDYGLAETVIRTESDRVYNDAVLKTAEDSGVDAYKQWKTREDDRVRHTHSYIDNVRVPLKDKFFTIDGDSALYPGNFSNVENNANCRCHIRITRK